MEADTVGSGVVAMTSFSESAASQSAAGESSRREPETWRETFLRILNNEGKRHPERGPARGTGFVVVATGVGSLQHLQRLCFAPGQRYNRCLTARYGAGGAPLPGSLIAAFAADLEALRAGRPRTVGEFLPAPELERDADNPWARMLGARPGEGPIPAGDLTRDGWLDRFMEVLADEHVLGMGDRLVLLAEAESAGWFARQDEEGLRALASRLPDRCGLVLALPDTPPRLLPTTAGGSPRTPSRVPRDSRVVDPSFAYLAVDKGDLPGRDAAAYREVALTGDQLADTDALDRDRYAAAVATLVMLPDTGPMTMGIHAPWGMGKSSFMRFVERHLLADALGYGHLVSDAVADAVTPVERRFLETATSVRQPPQRVRLWQRVGVNAVRRRAARMVIPVWFNAWQYEGATQIWAGLTHQITQAMEQSQPWPRRFATRVGYAVRRRGAQFWLGLFAPLLIAVLAAAVAIAMGLSGRLEELLPKDVGLLAAAVPLLVPVFAALYLAAQFFNRVKPVSEGLLDYVRQPNYREHMGYQHQVLDDIRYLAGRLRRRKRSPRVVVFIDDLDRCSDEKVLETLQAINLLLTASGCYVILGIDTDMIIRAIQRHFDFEGDPQDKARGYLRKILQLNLRLHGPAPGRKLGFLDDFFSAESREQLAEGAVGSTAGPTHPEPGPRGLPWDLAGVRAPARYVVQLNRVEDTPHELWAFHQLADLVPTNPRELKRLVNVHRLVKLVLTGAGVRPVQAEQRLLVGWLLFCFDAPVHAAVLVAKARRDAEASDDPEIRDRPVDDSRLNGVLKRLSGQPTPAHTEESEEDTGPLRLTVGQLLPGTQYSEAWEISSLFRLSA